MARALRERIRHELDTIRKELIEDVSPLENLDYAPVAGMKSYRSLLKEIGAMEFESANMLRNGRVPVWAECEAQVVGETAGQVLQSLVQIRSLTMAYLDSATDGDLRKALAVPEVFADYFGDSELEAEELLRWVARHEYYHHGQIVTYRWIQGHNPYQRTNT